METIRKKSLLGLLLLTALSITFTACDGCKDRTNGGDDKPKEEVKAPEQIISPTLATEFYDNYTEHRKGIIKDYEESGARDEKGQEYDDPKKQQQMQQAVQEQDSFDVARFGYYKLETLKQYIAYIEQEAARADVEISTVRIYFTNYPAEGDYVHPKQNSFVFVPTLNRNGTEYAFSVVKREGEDKWRPSLFDRELRRLDEKSMMEILGADNKEEASLVPNFFSSNSYISPALFQQEHSLKLNEGSMVPPPH